jgi:hypothetical protein
MQIAEPLSETGATEADIQQLENDLGHRLPEDYRRFLAQINGGRPERISFPIQTSGEATNSVVDWLLTLNAKERNYTITKFRRAYVDRIPTGVIPIGCDPFGNLILLGTMGKDFGNVYFWDHELENMDEPTWENISFVAKSFTDFEQSLQKVCLETGEIIANDD